MFFRNVKAKEEDFKIFGLTQRELDFVLGRTHNHIRRAFLLRRMSETDGVESVIIDADMGPLGVGLQTFASGNASVRMIRELAQKDPRSEEHTSELQSLMRISYAVFCLKKKKTNQRR